MKRIKRIKPFFARRASKGRPNKHSKPGVYDDFADTFGKSRENMHWPEIDLILADFVQSHADISDWKIGDIGCGTGRLVSHIAESPDLSSIFLSHKTSYVGLDLSERLLEKAQRIDTSEIFDSAQWAQGDMRSLNVLLSEMQQTPPTPPYQGGLDALFFVASFHHLTDYSARLGVLTQAKELLSENGKIYFTNWNLLDSSQSRYESSIMKTYDDGSADFAIKIGQFDRFYHAFSEEEYHRLAEETGFKIQRMEFGERNSVLILQ